MNIAAVKERDIANGPGVRVSLFVSGCTHRCPGCFNAETWDFSYGAPFTEADADRILSLLEPDFVAGLSLLGGEPFEPVNQKGLLPLLRRVRARYPQKTIWCYTGYTYERDLLAPSRARCAETDEMLSLLDVLVDGEYVAALRNIRLRFRGSENQRILDLHASRLSGTPTLWHDPDLT